MPERESARVVASRLGRWGAKVLLAFVVVALVAGMARVDLPGLTSGRFWSDGATYYAMAWSLARDGDVRYEARDLERVRREYPAGPDGLFLKRASGGLALDREGGFPWLRRVRPEERRLYFAKALLYPLVAAPLVVFLGTRGLLLVNALALALVLVLGHDVLRRRLRPWPALGAGLVLMLGSVIPVYLFWPQPELLNLALVTGGLWAWATNRPRLSAVLFGLATYSKPPNLLLALPLGVAPLVGSQPGQRLAGLRESLRRGLWLGLTAALLFGVNALATGEANYQGGERKTFMTRFPFASPELSFDNTGAWMTTEHVGPHTGDAASAGQAERGTIVRDRGELPAAFLRNLGYFWIGRYAGVVPYFFPFAVFLAGFLLAGSRGRKGWLAVATLVLSWWAFIALIPDNWYGGGGTVGNRYFLSLVPLALFLAPRRLAGWWNLVAAIGAAVLTLPILAHPIADSLEPWRNAQRPVLQGFPLELTMLNDLGFCSDPWRKKQPFGDPEGDPRTGRPPDPTAYWLYFPDDGTFGREVVAGVEGFWLRRGRRAEIVLRAHHPVRRLTASVDGGPGGDIVRFEDALGPGPLLVAPNVQRDVELDPGRGCRFYGTWVYRLALASEAEAASAIPAPGDNRLLGAFVSLRIEVADGPAG